MKILMVLTSHDQLGSTGRPNGFWLEEFAAPYFVFKDAGVELTLASPKGGQPPLDPKSDLPQKSNAGDGALRSRTRRRKKALANTVKLADMQAEDFDTRFLSRRARPDVGSRGEPYVDRSSGGLLQLRQAGIALVCHSPRCFAAVTYQGALRW